jgi:hypothetical protein
MIKRIRSGHLAYYGCLRCNALNLDKEAVTLLQRPLYADAEQFALDKYKRVVLPAARQLITDRNNVLSHLVVKIRV